MPTRNSVLFGDKDYKYYSFTGIRESRYIEMKGGYMYYEYVSKVEVGNVDGEPSKEH
jgi:hypothetical protein